MNIENAVYRILGWKILGREKIEGKDVIVVRKGERVEIVYDHIIHSQIFDGKIFTGQYWDYMMAPPALFKKSRVLVMGLGGGTVPYQMKKIFGGRIGLDVVEKSSKMIELSKVFLPEKLDMNVINEEAVRYIKGVKSAYDIIISDIYVGGKIPEELFMSKNAEYFNRALKSNGVLVINYALTADSLSRKSGLVRRLERFFKVYQMSYPGARGNLILVCSKNFDAEEISERICGYFGKIKEKNRISSAYSRLKEA